MGEIVRKGCSVDRGDESQYEAWWKSLTPKEKREHEKEIKRSIDKANDAPHPTVRRGVVRGICKKCGAAVMEGKSVFSKTEEFHKECGGELMPITKSGGVKTAQAKKCRASHGDVSLSMWETTSGGVRAKIATMNSEDTIVIPADKRNSFEEVLRTLSLNLCDWNTVRRGTK